MRSLAQQLQEKLKVDIPKTEIERPTVKLSPLRPKGLASCSISSTGEPPQYAERYPLGRFFALRVRHVVSHARAYIL